MKNCKKITFFSLIIVLVCSCFSACKWSDAQRKEFETECNAKTTFSNTLFLFVGFENSEFDSVLVKEYKSEMLLDSFHVFVNPAQNAVAKDRKKRSGTIARTMNVNYEYHFLVPGHEVYKLSDMKMIMWAQFSAFSENYDCVMGDYTLDGTKFEHSGNLAIVKR